MSLIELLVLSVGLSMDAVAVSIASGLILKKPRLSQAFKMAFAFGAFQALMPLLGWGAGVGLRRFISGIDHWITFVLLLIIGIKMIHESRKTDLDEGQAADPMGNVSLLILSVATSIDAFAAGIGFALLKVNIFATVTVIGTVTFLLSFLGVLLGNSLGAIWEKEIRIAGGVILIGIGLKILIDHLMM